MFRSLLYFAVCCDVGFGMLLFIPPGNVSRVNFGPEALEIKSYPPKSTFSEDHISAPKGVALPNFYEH